MFTLKSPPLQEISSPDLNSLGVRLRVLRLDLIHPTIQGNKWYKLRYNLEQARSNGQKVLVSFGGAFSNHLAALAAAGKEFGFQTVGLVRGELVQPLNPVLQFAQDQGMHLLPIPRSDYAAATRWVNTQTFREIETDSSLPINRLSLDAAESCPESWIQQSAALRAEYGDYFLIPEGGGNLAAARGCIDIADSILNAESGRPDCIMLACATGTTLAGLGYGLQRLCSADRNADRKRELGENCRTPELIGIPVLKAKSAIDSQARQLITGLSRIPSQRGRDADHFADHHRHSSPLFQTISGWEAGGYAKTTPELLEFINNFHHDTGLPLEPVYTGKLFYALMSLLRSEELSDYHDIVAIHTGGITSSNLNKLYKTKN